MVNIVYENNKESRFKRLIKVYKEKSNNWKRNIITEINLGKDIIFEYKWNVGPAKSITNFKPRIKEIIIKKEELEDLKKYIEEI